MKRGVVFISMLTVALSLENQAFGADASSQENWFHKFQAYSQSLPKEEAARLTQLKLTTFDCVAYLAKYIKDRPATKSKVAAQITSTTVVGTRIADICRDNMLGKVTTAQDKQLLAKLHDLYSIPLARDIVRALQQSK